MERTKALDVNKARKNAAREFAIAGAIGLAALAFASRGRAQPAEEGGAPEEPAKGAEQPGEDSAERRRVMQPGEAPGETNGPDAGEKPADAQPADAGPAVDVTSEATVVTVGEEEAYAPTSAFDLMGFYHSPYSSTIIRPLLSSEGQLEGAVGPSVSARANKRAVPMFEFNASVSLGLAESEEYGTYTYATTGVGMSAMMARGRGQYGSYTWPIGEHSFLEGANGGQFGGYLELHQLWRLEPGLPEALGKAAKGDFSGATDQEWQGIDLSLHAGLNYSTMSYKVPFSVAGVPQEKDLSGDSFSFPLGLELAVPHLFGEVSPFRFEAAGFGFVPASEIYNAYIAVSGNFSQDARLLLTPRFTDTLGDRSIGGDLKVDMKPAHWVQTSAAFIAMHTIQPGTTALGGYGELWLGGGNQASQHALASVRAGYIAEVGGEAADRIPSTVFMALNLTGSPGPIY